MKYAAITCMILGVLAANVAAEPVWPAVATTAASEYGPLQPAGRPISAAHPTSAAPQISAAQPAIVRSAHMDINYHIDGVDRAHLDRIELWYAASDDPWQFYGYDHDRISPVRFIAPGEGVFRLLVVAVDRWNRRSLEPAYTVIGRDGVTIPPNVPPHALVLVDYTPPQLYLYAPGGDLHDYQPRTLTLRWAGFDNNLPEQPVQLFYQRYGEDDWRPLGPAQPAAGEYNWRFPDDLTGLVIVQAVITDKAGNRTGKLSDWINITSTGSGEDHNATPPPAEMPPASPPPTRAPQTAPATPSASLTQTVGVALPTRTPGPNRPSPAAVPEVTAPPAANPSDSEKATEWFNRGQLHSQRQEWSEAARAFEQALECDRGHLEAHIMLGRACYNLGQFDRAESHYQEAIQLSPHMTTTLLQLARAQMAQQRFVQAQQTLDRLLALDPSDWSAWLLRGDNAERLGNLSLAMDSWRVAAQGARESFPGVAQMAQDRLRSYQP